MTAQKLTLNKQHSLLDTQYRLIELYVYIFQSSPSASAMFEWLVRSDLLVLVQIAPLFHIPEQQLMS